MLTKRTLEIARRKNVLVHLRPSSKLCALILQHFKMYPCIFFVVLPSQSPSLPFQRVEACLHGRECVHFGQQANLWFYTLWSRSRQENTTSRSELVRSSTQKDTKDNMATGNQANNVQWKHCDICVFLSCLLGIFRFEDFETDQRRVKVNEMFSMAISNNILLTKFWDWFVLQKHQLEELSGDSHRETWKTRKIKRLKQTIINPFKTWKDWKT